MTRKINRYRDLVLCSDVDNEYRFLILEESKKGGRLTLVNRQTGQILYEDTKGQLHRINKDYPVPKKRGFIWEPCKSGDYVLMAFPGLIGLFAKGSKEAHEIMERLGQRLEELEELED